MTVGIFYGQFVMWPGDKAMWAFSWWWWWWIGGRIIGLVGGRLGAWIIIGLVGDWVGGWDAGKVCVEV